MENVPVFVGLDYHSKSVQVCVVDGEGTILVNRKCGNSVLEIGAAIGPGREVARVAIESCCGAGRWPYLRAHRGVPLSCGSSARQCGLAPSAGRGAWVGVGLLHRRAS